MQLSKWGNSLAVRLPTAVIDALALKEGDDIEITIAGAAKFEISRKPGRVDMLAALRRFRGSLPADFHFDRDQLNSRDHDTPA